MIDDLAAMEAERDAALYELEQVTAELDALRHQLADAERAQRAAAALLEAVRDEGRAMVHPANV